MKYFSKIYVTFVLYITILLSVSIKGMKMHNNPSQTRSEVNNSIKEECELILNNCFCDASDKSLRSVVCKNMTDFSKIARFAQSLNVSIVYKFEFADTKYLPARSLQGLSVATLLLDDPDLTVHENVFEGMISLYRFDVKRSSIKDIPNFGIVRKYILYIYIQSSRLTSLEGKNLQNLTEVRDFNFTNNYIRFLDPDVFKGTENVEWLDLSYNLLTSLPPKLLDPMKYLHTFYISHNNLHHVDNVFSTTHPMIIRMDFNNITDIDSVLHFNMERVHYFNIGGNPIKKVSENSFTGKIPNVGQLLLDHCELREFTIEHFRSLSYLWMLDLSHNLIEDVSEPEEISTIEGQMTHGQIYKKILDLSSNKLQSLFKLQAFQKYMKFSAMTVAGNEIQYLRDKDFKSLQDIVGLVLRDNGLRRIDTFTFQPITDYLKYLDLSFNLITSLNRSLSVLSELQFLNLSHNLIERFEEMDLAFLHKLSKLYLQHNRIKVLGDMAQLCSLQYLDISFNNIELIHSSAICYYTGLEKEENPKTTSEIQKAVLESLNLSENKLPSLNPNLQLINVVRLQIDRNEIQYLTDEDFIYANIMAHLELQKNEIRRIENGTFKFMRKSLIYLDLSFNLITSLNGSIKYLPQLIFLNLSHNLIQAFSKDEFIGLNELSGLYLHSNEIKTLGWLQQLPHLQYLVITHNNIEYIRPDRLPKDLKSIFLAGNPFQCDCRIQSLIHRIKNYSLETDVHLCQKYHLVSNRNSECPSMCSCVCTEYKESFFISVECTSRNLSVVPEFLLKHFTEIEDNATVPSNYQSPLVMNENIHSSFHIKDRVLGINLENNNLESLESAHLPPNLVHLFLSNNKLRRLPDSIFEHLKHLKQVSLSGNLWVCDCSAIKFKKWLIFNKEIIQDFNDTRCGVSEKGETDLSGRLIWTLSELELCPSYLELILSVSISVLILIIIALMTKVLYTRYELNIKAFLYSHGLTFVKEKDLEHDKVFDAFISFSNRDGDFVAKHIIPVIENKNPDIQLCLNYRHSLVGRYETDNIIDAVENSKRTVIILSRNFLESPLCLFELRRAHQKSIKDKVSRIIVIRIGDLPKEVDPTIKVQLNTRTYMTWGEKNFWNKLLYVLPSSRSDRNFFPKNVEETENL